MKRRTWIASLLAVAFFSQGCALVGIKDDVEGAISLAGSIELAFEAGNLTFAAFDELSTATGGVAYRVDSLGEINASVELAMTSQLDPNEPVDIAFVVDTTGSMGDDIERVQSGLTEMVDTLEANNPDWQVGVVEFRDLGDDFVSRVESDLTNDVESAKSAIANLDVAGGGDWCEHVYAGVDTGLRDISWREGTSKRLIVIGDAPPHNHNDSPRTFDEVTAFAGEVGAEVFSVTAYCDELCQGISSILTGGGSCD